MQPEVLFNFICWLPLIQFSWLLIGYYRPISLNSAKYGAGSITVVIPYRNEEKNLPKLIKNLNGLKLAADDRIFLVDDGSKDSGIPNDINLRKEISILPLQDHAAGSKKLALSHAIRSTSTDWILTTDADCEFGPDWVEAMRNHLNKDIHMLIGPVLTTYVSGFVELFQPYESICLWSVTKASSGWNIPVLCSGANLLFRRSTWIELDGYKSHEHISSGDDVLLMNDISKRWKKGVQTISDPRCLVVTTGFNSWKLVLNQRKRWISKTNHLTGFNKKLLVIGLIFWLCLPVFAFFYDFRWPGILLVGETIFIWSVLQGFSRPFNAIHWLFFRLLYPFFLVVLLFYNPRKLLWKGRVVQ